MTTSNASNPAFLSSSSPWPPVSPCSRSMTSDSELEELVPPTGKRLAPVGANEEEDDLMLLNFGEQCVISGKQETKGEDTFQLRKKLGQLEEEQEELSNSLMSMTSHYAKVSD